MIHLAERISRIRSWAAELLARADFALCVEEDEWAVRRGWTVTKAGFGARRYRDPRFDALKAARTAAYRAEEVGGHVFS
ncbi:hypothetical protein [Nonomuraea sp. NPDC005650]|uniref:hypothetical protein n=1 Tax=Nonomuraea sp. NPDC005650 TaxID=3157045 RepID=UPI00339E8EB1